MHSQKEGARYISKSIQFHKFYYRRKYEVSVRTDGPLSARQDGSEVLPPQRMAHESSGVNSLLSIDKWAKVFKTDRQKKAQVECYDSELGRI